MTAREPKCAECGGRKRVRTTMEWKPCPACATPDDPLDPALPFEPDGTVTMKFGKEAEMPPVHLDTDDADRPVKTSEADDAERLAREQAEQGPRLDRMTTGAASPTPDVHPPLSELLEPLRETHTCGSCSGWPWSCSCERTPTDAGEWLFLIAECVMFQLAETALEGRDND